MPQQHRYICMVIGFFVTCFFAYITFSFVILDLISGVKTQVREISVSYSDGMMIVITLSLFAYTIPFLVLNRKRMKKPLEIWEIYKAKKVSVISVIILFLIVFVGVAFKNFEVNYLKLNGYELSHTKENHRAFGFDTDVYILNQFSK